MASRDEKTLIEDTKGDSNTPCCTIADKPLCTREEFREFMVAENPMLPDIDYWYAEGILNDDCEFIREEYVEWLAMGKPKPKLFCIAYDAEIEEDDDRVAEV